MADPVLLQLHEVTKRYRSGTETVVAASGVCIGLEPGELVALYGPSGSGKTTLLLTAAGIVRPDAGTVRYRGTDIGTLTERERVAYRRDELGFVLQSWHLQPGLDALDNAATKLVAAGMRPRAARSRALVMLKLVGLGVRARHLPHELSTGERQRVGIARALVNEPRLMLADEPTGNLDSQRGELVLDLLADACEERCVAVLLVTHDPRAAGYASRVLTLNDGIVADAPRQAGRAVPVLDSAAPSD